VRSIYTVPTYPHSRVPEQARPRRGTGRSQEALANPLTPPSCADALDFPTRSVTEWRAKDALFTLRPYTPQLSAVNSWANSSDQFAGKCRTRRATGASPPNTVSKMSDACGPSMCSYTRHMIPPVSLKRRSSGAVRSTVATVLYMLYAGRKMRSR
jgi:hypothetical protein